MQTLRPLSKKEKESAAGLWGEKLQVPELFAVVCTSAPAPSLLLSDGNAFNSEQARCCGGGVLFSVFKMFAFQMQIQKEIWCP